MYISIKWSLQLIIADWTRHKLYFSRRQWWLLTAYVKAYLVYVNSLKLSMRCFLRAGTTLNLLKFPVNRPSRYMLAMRAQRLRELQETEGYSNTTKTRSIASTTLKGNNYRQAPAASFYTDGWPQQNVWLRAKCATRGGGSACKNEQAFLAKSSLPFDQAQVPVLFGLHSHRSYIGTSSIRIETS